jgi:hypothetical protein
MMPKYSVLMTTADYVEVEATDPRDAEMVAWEMYKEGDIRPEHPEFICEEADLIEGDDDGNDL